jgi:hypothetical protein
MAGVCEVHGEHMAGVREVHGERLLLVLNSRQDRSLAERLSYPLSHHPCGRMIPPQKPWDGPIVPGHADDPC